MEGNKTYYTQDIMELLWKMAKPNNLLFPTIMTLLHGESSIHTQEKEHKNQIIR